MTDETVDVSRPLAPSVSADESEALHAQLSDLLLERRNINLRIRALRVRGGKLAGRPLWGPCTRCGHVWRGLWAGHAPAGCPRCHSKGWNVEPTYKNSRLPEDPPNPNWYDQRKSRRRPRAFRPKHTGQSILSPPPRPDNLVVMAQPAASLAAPPEVRFALTPPPIPEEVFDVTVLPSPESAGEADYREEEARGNYDD